MIVIKDLNKYYNSGGEKFHALKDINLTFKEKGMNFILGKSGSGKSTLLNVVGGIDAYDSGEIIVDGISTKKFNAKQLNTYRNSYIGFIFQEFNVLKSLNVYENIALSLELQHLSVKDNQEKIAEIIELVGLTGLENRMMNQLSGGQRQRVAIARSLIKDPKLLIADEPTGNLDSKNSLNVMNLLKELSKDRLVIIVTHNEKLANDYGDRIIELKDGTITGDHYLNEELNNEDLELASNNDENSLNNHFISVPTKTSLHLSLKGVKKNLKRFIFISLLFTIALVLAGIVINMSFSNTTLTYAKYQDEYNNNIIGLDSEFQSRGYTTSSAFFTFQKNLFLDSYKQDEQTYSLVEGMKYNIPINQNSNEANEFYYPSINMVYNKATIPDGVFYQTTRITTSEEYVKVYVTDYLAESLIYQNYFNDPSLTVIRDVLEKEIIVEAFNKPLVITGIVYTNYDEFKDYFDLFNPGVKEDSKAQCAFFDNALFYNALFVDATEYEKLFSRDNIKYFYSDVIYTMVADTSTGENVLFTTYPDESSLEEDQKMKKAKGTSIPTKHEEGQPLQVAVTTGFFEKILNITVDPSQITSEESKADILFKKVYYEILTHPEGTEGKMEKIYASNFLCLTDYIPCNLTFIITTIVENDDPVVYLPQNEDSDDYKLLIESVFYDGNYLTLYFVENENLSNKNYLETNAKLYRKFINNDIIITNQSFQKVLLVDNFINNNLSSYYRLFYFLQAIQFLFVYLHHLSYQSIIIQHIFQLIFHHCSKQNLIFVIDFQMMDLQIHCI